MIIYEKVDNPLLRSDMINSSEAVGRLIAEFIVVLRFGPFGRAFSCARFGANYEPRFANSVRVARYDTTPTVFVQCFRFLTMDTVN